jgi:hypothetical protein
MHTATQTKSAFDLSILPPCFQEPDGKSAADLHSTREMIVRHIAADKIH